MSQMVSVVVPLYNKGAHILNTINSILDQTYPHFELIIVDDGSTDEGPRIVSEIKDPRVRLISQENAGVSAARNKGIENARYKLIAFLDADDEWLSNYLETIILLYKKYPRAKAYATLYCVVLENGTTMNPTHEGIKQEAWNGILEDFYLSSQYYTVISSDTIVIKKEVFEKIGGFDETISVGEDIHMWVRIFMKYKIALSNSRLARYHLGAQNRSMKNPGKVMKRDPVGKMLKEALKENKIPMNLRSSAYEYIASLDLNYAQNLIKIGQTAQGIREVLQTRTKKYHRRQLSLIYKAIFKRTKIKNQEQRKIRIAFLMAYAYPLFNKNCIHGFGGAEVDMYNVARYLSGNKDFEVHFYVGDFGQTNQIEEYGGIKVHKIRMFGWKNKNLKQKVIAYGALFKTLLFNKEDVVLTEMADINVGLAAIFFRILRRKGFIHRLASDADTMYTNPKASKGIYPYLMYNLGLKKANVIISQTQLQKELLNTHMGYNSIVGRNGFFVNNKNQDISTKKHILWVGRGVEIKRPELFVELAKRLPDKQFLMIMNTNNQVINEAFKAKTEKMLEEVRRIPNFIFKDYIPFDEVQEYYDEAQLLVNTSSLEGFPNVFLQACMGATPIASLSVNPDDFINKNGLGIYCENDFEKLVTFIESLSREQIQRYGNNAKRYVYEHHNIEDLGLIYEEKIKEIVNRKR